MNLDKLFHVLVVAGAASTVGIAGCGSDDDDDGGGGTGGTSSSGGSSNGGSGGASGGSGGSGGAASGGTAGSGGSSAGAGGSGDQCDAVCMPSDAVESWIDCNGCCCWLPIGSEAGLGAPTCGEEPCCVGRGR